ncbi:MAG: HlyD family efflux transporter periplasmic adaptor subunit [Methylotenera sp.]|nr:HlyD family efflux transporter periplasmic adaptor subunit [Oligoflexia bacterium]
MTTQLPKKSHRKMWISAASTLAILGIGIGYFRWNAGTDVARPRMGPVVEAVYGLGTVIAPQTYQVKTAVNQGIREIYVKEGDSVQAGAPLIRFDDSGISRAPFSGTVTTLPFKRGEILFPGTPALTLVNLGDLFLEVSLEQQSVLRVKRNEKAFVSFESIRGDRVQAKVESVFPREAQFIVRIVLDRFPPGILPGMTADVAIEVGRKENVLSIPLRSLSSGKVTLRRAGKKIKETVQVGVVDGEWAEVTSRNIEPEDEILIRSR